MSQKDRLPIIGSKTTIFGLLKPILSHNSPLLRDKLPLTSVFAYIAANGFIGGLVFKFACPNTDYQQLMSLYSPFPIFIGQQYLKTKMNWICRVRRYFLVHHIEHPINQL